MGGLASALWLLGARCCQLLSGQDREVGGGNQTAASCCHDGGGSERDAASCCQATLAEGGRGRNVIPDLFTLNVNYRYVAAELSHLLRDGDAVAVVFHLSLIHI